MAREAQNLPTIFAPLAPFRGHVFFPLDVTHLCGIAAEPSAA
jgi:hypothetical protein